MANVIGGPVAPHAQAFADAADPLTASHFSTYGSHQPTRDRALDIFGNRAEGDAVVRFFEQNHKHYGGDYIIWRQQIWNPDISPNWRRMADRGGVTANHYDHVHVSFEPTGAAKPSSPAPSPISEEEFTMADIAHIDASITAAVATLDTHADARTRDVLEAIRKIGHATTGVDNATVDQVVDGILIELAERAGHDPNPST